MKPPLIKSRSSVGRQFTFILEITNKLHEMVVDLRSADVPEDLFATARSKAEIKLHGGSCLNILPKLKTESYDGLITSPPFHYSRFDNNDWTF